MHVFGVFVCVFVHACVCEFVCVCVCVCVEGWTNVFASIRQICNSFYLQMSC